METTNIGYILVQLLVGLGLAIAAYRTAMAQANKGLKVAEERSGKNSKDIEILQASLGKAQQELTETKSILDTAKQDLLAERSAREAAVRAIEEWQKRDEDKENRIRTLESQILIQQGQLSANKSAMDELIDENRNLHAQLDVERGLRTALQNRMDAEDGAMTKALSALTEIVRPFISLAVANTQIANQSLQKAEPAA